MFSSATLDFNAIIQVIAAVSAAIAAGLSYRQCKTMEKQLDGDRYLRQNEKAIELARLFADDIVPRSSYITSIVHCSDSFKSIAEKIRGSDVSRFNDEEFREIVGGLPKDAISRIREDFFMEEARVSIGQARMKLQLLCPDDAFPIPAPPKAGNPDSGQTDGDGAKEKNSEIEEYWKMFSALSFQEFTSISTDLLNCLEHFCMALNSEVADDEVLYPSLHQVFFSIVDSLYLFICSTNSGNPTDRYYTHVIKLYNKWIKRHGLDQQLMKEAESEIYAKYEEKKKRQLR